MLLRSLRVGAAAVLLAGSLWAGARPVGPLPPLGPLLDPANGVWANARVDDRAAEGDAVLPGLGADVRVVYDVRGVPHIFAAREEDVYRALGWVVARDRLFQLYVQTLAASGRLTEIGGARLLDADREMRRLGLPRAAERRAAAIDTSGASWRLARAYADGVNAYLAHLPAREVPVEFRLLGVRPPRWEPVNSMHLMNRMGWTLAYIVPEADRSAAAARVGARAAAALFPAAAPIVEPIQPNGQRAPRVDSAPPPPPGAPEPGAAIVASALDALMPASAAERAARRARGADVDEPRSMASNNWAVAPSRAAGGHALLAGDPHLELTLPSIWYEAHLVVPGQLDVYGVTIPGAPGIVIGFNRDVAWTFTNTGADVLDLYEETVDDSLHPTRYRLDGQWRPLDRRIETYRGKAGEVVGVDTLYFTHRGPMQHQGARWLSVRWTVLEPGDEAAGFAAAARAHSARELLDAMARSYWTPAQNMLAADRGGNIGIRSTGHYPVRPDSGGGLTVRDGAASGSDWRGFLPVERYPQALNPAQGYLASANQQPIDPRVSAPDYWGGSYDPWRALRINALLRADSSVTPDDMRRFQTDPGSERANWFAPRFLSAAARALARARAGRPVPHVDTAVLATAARLLGAWDRRYTRENTRAVLFEAAMRRLVDRTWDELLVPDSAGGARRVATPSTAVLAVLLTDSASAWWDDRRTADVVETRDDVVARALAEALETVRRESGEPDGAGWTWSRVRHAAIRHLLQLPSFSALDLPVQGGPSTLSPSSGSGTHGASWRMVVELGPEVRAWSIYPGGQSGNPASARYRDRLARWLAGELDTLVVPRTPAELPGARVASTLILRPSPAP